MKTHLDQLSSHIEYPDEDGKPMAESDQARKYLTYSTSEKPSVMPREN